MDRLINPLEWISGLPSRYNVQHILIMMLPLIATGIGVFLYKGYRARKLFGKLHQIGMPMPKWHPILGHLLCMPPILKDLPPDVHRPEPIARLAKTLDDKWDGTFYLDVWPFSNPLLVTTSPLVAIQGCQQHDLIKPSILKLFFDPLAGGDNLFTMNGHEWKRSRVLFNPGFSANYILNQMRHIVDETLVYVEILREHVAANTMFSLDEITLWFVMDVIGIVSLNSRFHSQRQYNPLAHAMRSQIKWHILHDEFNPFIRFNPIRPLVQWYNSRVMNNYISHELDKRYAEFLAKSMGEIHSKPAASRFVIDLAIEDYMSQQKSSQLPKYLSREFKRWAEVQIRLFLFAGHDSTASTICYCYYLLSKHPEALRKVLAEHDYVFGKDLSKTADLLLEKPTLINELPYTLAVIKETLRLFPPAQAMRGGRPDVEIQIGDHKLPTANMNIWVLHHAVHRNPKYWPQPDEFLPERWLVDPDHPLYPPKGGFRPFEHGPRNCPGQPLVYLDVKVCLVLTMREFDIRDAYEEFDKSNPSKHIKTVDGERAYPRSEGGVHPADGFPCRVRFRNVS